MTYNCLIVDDEPLARKVIEKHLQSFPELTLLAAVESATSAFELLHTRDIHLIFLDIQIPLINGLQFIRSIKHPPAIIFTTAYSEFAAESYELDAIDYIVKPVSFERMERSIQKFLKTVRHEPEDQKQFLLIKQDGKLNRVSLDEILYIEARKDYLMIYTPGDTYIKHMTMKSIEKLLPEQQFKRVHRSFIVAAGAITAIKNNVLQIDKKGIPIGEKYRKEVVRHFMESGN